VLHVYPVLAERKKEWKKERKKEGKKET